MEKPAFINVLAAICVIGFFTVLVLLFFKEIPEGNKDVVNILIGVLASAGFSGVIGYFFNSSKGSKDKDVTIKNLSEPEKKI